MFAPLRGEETWYLLPREVNAIALHPYGRSDAHGVALLAVLAASLLCARYVLSVLSGLCGKEVVFQTIQIRLLTAFLRQNHSICGILALLEF